MNYSYFELEKGSMIYLAFFDENLDLDLKNIPLSSSDIEKLSTITSVQRRKEMLFTRAMLYELYPNEKIMYSENGAPFLASMSKKISISHSEKCVALMISRGDCGVDIELSDRNFKPVAKRLLTPKDIEIDENDSLAAAWVAKEALFKAFSKDQLEIFLDISICKIDNNRVECRVKDRKISVQIVKHRGHLVAGVENFEI